MSEILGLMINDPTCHILRLWFRWVRKELHPRDRAVPIRVLLQRGNELWVVAHVARAVAYLGHIPVVEGVKSTSKRELGLGILRYRHFSSSLIERIDGKVTSHAELVFNSVCACRFPSGDH